MRDEYVDSTIVSVEFVVVEVSWWEDSATG
jgi:hypothetical protein